MVGTEAPVTVALLWKLGWMVTMGERDSVEDPGGLGMLTEEEGGELRALREEHGGNLVTGHVVSGVQVA